MRHTIVTYTAKTGREQENAAQPATVTQPIARLDHAPAQPGFPG